MFPIEQSAFEAAIVDACSKHEEAHWKEHSFRRCVSIGAEYFVKYGSAKAIWPELATQTYIFEYAQSHLDTPHIPRIPKVIHHFKHGLRIYMVMEYITLVNPGDDISERTSEALKWLSEVPAPPGHVFGPLGGGVIRHRFFKDYEAPLAFSSVEALERYIEKVRLCLHLFEHLLKYQLYQASETRCKWATPLLQPVSFLGERMMFMQADMHPDNFGVDEHGNTVLMNFAEVAMLPESFAALTLISKRHAVSAKSLNLSKSSNVISIAEYSSLLWSMADETLGTSICSCNGIQLKVTTLQA